jgi:hypothetical protein
VGHLRAALEANEAARPSANTETLDADLKAARRRITELEEAARPAAASPAALSEPLPVLANQLCCCCCCCYAPRTAHCNLRVTLPWISMCMRAKRVA